MNQIADELSPTTLMVPIVSNALLTGRTGEFALIIIIILLLLSHSLTNLLEGTLDKQRVGSL